MWLHVQNRVDPFYNRQRGGLFEFLMMHFNLSFMIVSCKGCGLSMLSVQIDGFSGGFCINEAWHWPKAQHGE